jgi:hypothetical protein
MSPHANSRDGNDCFLPTTLNEMPHMRPNGTGCLSHTTADQHLARSFLRLPDATTVSRGKLVLVITSPIDQKRKDDGHCRTENMARM